VSSPVDSATIDSGTADSGTVDRAGAPRGIIIITGTSTGVGKTIVTAAVAALALQAGRRVAVVKLAQTGIHHGAGSDIPDIDTVRRLSGVTDTYELARFPDPLSPEAAARRSGLVPVNVSRAVNFTADLAADRDLVLVEGAGGLLVRYDSGGTTIADFAAALDAPLVVVTAAGLGTLNHTALTLEALAARKLVLAGVVVGSWPPAAGVAEQENLTDLRTLIGGALAGLLPEGAALLPPERFLAAARAGLAVALGGDRVLSVATRVIAPLCVVGGQIRRQVHTLRLVHTLAAGGNEVG
jgi:dethiobiotin synthase